MVSELEELKQALQQLARRIEALEKKITGKQGAIEQQRPAPRKKQKSTFNWPAIEHYIAAYWLQAIGAIAVIAGISFFLKYAIDHALFSPVIRIASGFGVGTCLLMVGYYSYTRYKHWSFASMAAGLVTYYATVLAAYHGYYFLTTVQAFVAFFVIAALALAIALWYNTRFLGLFSAGGALVIPLLLSTSLRAINPLFLVFYLLFVAGCYQILAYYKRWFSISYLTLFILIAYQARYFVTVSFSGALLHSSLSCNENLLFLTGLWALYMLVPFVVSLVRAVECIAEPISIAISTWVTATMLRLLVFADFFDDCWLCRPMVTLHDEQRLTYLYAGLAFVYSLFALVVLFVRMAGHRYVLRAVWLCAVAFAVVASFLQWTGYLLCAALLAIAAACMGVGLQGSDHGVRVVGYLLQLMALGLLGLNIAVERAVYVALVYNDINIAFLLMLFAAGIVVYLVQYYRDRLLADEQQVPLLSILYFLLLPCCWLFTSLWVFQYRYVALAVYCLLLFVIGVYKKQLAVRIAAYLYSLLVIGIFTLKVIVSHQLSVVLRAQCHVLFIVFLGCCIAALLVLRHKGGKLPIAEYNRIQQALYTLLAFFVLTFVRHLIIFYSSTVSYRGSFFDRWVTRPEETAILVRTGLTTALLAIFYSFYGLLLLVVGLVQDQQLLRWGAFGILFMALGKVVVVLVGLSNSWYRIGALLIVGALLIGGSLVYQRLDKK